ncbi:MAG: hypothetical protein AAGE99_02325 [Chlamydiota bacterium]
MKSFCIPSGNRSIEKAEPKQRRSFLMCEPELADELFKKLQRKLHLIRNFAQLGTECIDHGLTIAALMDVPLTSGWIEFDKNGGIFRGNLNVHVKKVMIKSRFKEYIQEEDFGLYSHKPFDIRKLEELITEAVKESIASI